MIEPNKPETDEEIEVADTRAETLRRYQATLAARPRSNPTPSSPLSQSSKPAKKKVS